MPNIINRIYNPVSGFFGNGQIETWVGATASSGAQTSATFTWTVPAGVGAVRVRMWGGGGTNGGGGAFCLKTIYDLSGVTSVLVTVGFGGNGTTITGGTSSFGAYASATGGVGTGGAGGTATGGDINFSGGTGANAGAASIFGPGAAANASFPGAQGFGGAGATIAVTSQSAGGSLLAQGGVNTLGSVIVTPAGNPTSGLQKFSIDFIGTGGGSITNGNGINGSGGGANITGVTGGIPGGGGRLAGAGMVIVEY